MYIYKTFIILACLFGNAKSNVNQRFYQYNTKLQGSNDLRLEWSVLYEERMVYFRVQGILQNQQWLTFGFSDYGKISNADLVMYWIDVFGGVHFQDCWSDQMTVHVDHYQDYVLTYAHTEDNYVFLEFHRKFDTCDCKDYRFDTGTTHIVYAMGNGQLLSVNGLNLSEMSPGLQRVQLLKPNLPEIIFPRDTWTFEIRAPQVVVPGVETTYWWYTTELPVLREKHHIIKYEGIITDSNHELVHHIEVFHCEVRRHKIIPYYNGPGTAEGKPPELEACRKVIGAWAMGAQAMVLPKEAGTPIGGRDLSRFVLLEIHYNNPQLRKGTVDSSGIRFYVTSRLRKYDSGIMELGLEYTNKMAIPPGQEKFHLTGYCTPTCTHKGLPPDGIHVYASQLHTHLTGKKVYTKHLRDGIELPELNRDNHYSPHFQEIRLLPEQVHVLPGDELITTCVDNTVQRQNVTVGGLSIHDEMCVNYIHYYPRVHLEVCKSSVSTDSLNGFFQLMHRWNKNVSRTNGVEQNYKAIDWSPLSVDFLKAFYKTSPLSVQCNQSDGNRFPGEWENQPIPLESLRLRGDRNQNECGWSC